MNVRYFFSIFFIIFFLSSGANASDRTLIQGETSFIISPTLSRTALFSNKQVRPLLNKVIMSAHSSNQVAFWKSVTSFFMKVALVYANLWQYLYSSIFSIFK
ncbi:hypothetical protein MCW_01537 [Cardidatus Bartonella washoeensis 085-0475]|uniref:Uncharacterized protein n=1 Tax=Cardidatus Bartonella washoeensis 085-0475 TaxID=1094564 RepID=J0Z5J2_9HYPH|nr:hypothetical protein MCW_01537 [Bartonella washoeensis 085-0475]